ncbi:MAG: AtpZ/AtpI family protein [Flavobacteriales bacterium]|nr:AtpZ/AtpI family protein [Flavobacteriales bacterium]
MATQMGITIFLGVWGGQKLDKYFQTKTPWFTLLLSLVSVGIALYAVIKDFTKKAT